MGTGMGTGMGVQGGRGESDCLIFEIERLGVVEERRGERKGGRDGELDGEVVSLGVLLPFVVLLLSYLSKIERTTCDQEDHMRS